MNINTANAPAMARPPRENWSLGDFKRVDFQKDQLTSTQDLVDHPERVPEKGTFAAYTFQRDCQLMKPGTAKEYALTTLKGAAAGAAVGAVCGVGLNIIGSVLNVFTLGALGVQTLALGIPAAMGAVMGVVVADSSRHSEHADYPHYGESLNGKVIPEYGPDGKAHLAFYPWGELSAKVGLEEFAKAPVIPGGEMGSENGQWWQGASPNVDY